MLQVLSWLDIIYNYFTKYQAVCWQHSLYKSKVNILQKEVEDNTAEILVRRALCKWDYEQIMSDNTTAITLMINQHLVERPCDSSNDELYSDEWVSGASDL